MARTPWPVHTRQRLPCRACRALPAELAQARFEEWSAELPAILHDPGTAAMAGKDTRPLSPAGFQAAATALACRRLVHHSPHPSGPCRQRTQMHFQGHLADQQVETPGCATPPAEGRRRAHSCRAYQRGPELTGCSGQPPVRSYRNVPAASPGRSSRGRSGYRSCHAAASGWPRCGPHMRSCHAHGTAALPSGSRPYLPY